MTTVVAKAAHGAAIVSVLYAYSSLFKQGLKGINFVAKNVFQSTRPEQFVVTLMGKAPCLVNRFVDVLNCKVGGVLIIIITVAALFFCDKHKDKWDKCKERFREGSEDGARLREWIRSEIAL